MFCVVVARVAMYKVHFLLGLGFGELSATKRGVISTYSFLFITASLISSSLLLNCSVVTTSSNYTKDRYWCSSMVIVAWLAFAEKNLAKFLSYSYSSWLNFAARIIELITRFHVEPTTKFSLSLFLIGSDIKGVICS